MAAAQIVLDAVAGDPDKSGTRRYRLPDGRSIALDPENASGGEIYAEAIEDGRVVRTIGQSKRLILADDETAALRTLLSHAISDTAATARPACSRRCWAGWRNGMPPLLSAASST